MCVEYDLYLDYLFRTNNNPKYLQEFKQVLKDMFIGTYGTRSYSQTNNILTCLVYNIVRSYNRGCLGLYVSRDSNSYNTDVIYNGQIMNFKIGYQGMTKWLDFLEEQNLIISHKGYFVDSKNKENGYILFTDRLLSMINTHVDKSKLKFKLLENVLVLRDIDGQDLPFRRTKEIKTMIDLINSYNKFMSEQQVTLYGEKLTTEIHRSFSRSSFDKGGRYYSSGKGIQQINKADRLKVLINNENIVELDYKALHPSILFEKKGIILDENFDVYGGEAGQFLFYVNTDYVLKRREYDKKYNPVRNFLKKSLLILINGREESQVIFKINQLLAEDKKYEEKDRLFEGIVDPDAETAIEFLKEHNYLISDYFHSDAGIDLQKVDSDILSMIIEYCVQREIPILTVHDSVIVQQKFAGELITVMKESYKTVVGSNNNCRIEV